MPGCRAAPARHDVRNRVWGDAAASLRSARRLPLSHAERHSAEALAGRSRRARSASAHRCRSRDRAGVSAGGRVASQMAETETRWAVGRRPPLPRQVGFVDDLDARSPHFRNRPAGVVKSRRGETTPTPREEAPSLGGLSACVRRTDKDASAFSQDGPESRREEHVSVGPGLVETRWIPVWWASRPPIAGTRLPAQRRSQRSRCSRGGPRNAAVRCRGLHGCRRACTFGHHDRRR